MLRSYYFIYLRLDQSTLCEICIHTTIIKDVHFCQIILIQTILSQINPYLSICLLNIFVYCN